MFIQLLFILSVEASPCNGIAICSIASAQNPTNEMNSMMSGGNACTYSASYNMGRGNLPIGGGSQGGEPCTYMPQPQPIQPVQPIVQPIYYQQPSYSPPSYQQQGGSIGGNGSSGGNQTECELYATIDCKPSSSSQSKQFQTGGGQQQMGQQMNGPCDCTSSMGGYAYGGGNGFSNNGPSYSNSQQAICECVRPARPQVAPSYGGSNGSSQMNGGAAGGVCGYSGHYGGYQVGNMPSGVFDCMASAAKQVSTPTVVIGSTEMPVAPNFTASPSSCTSPTMCMVSNQ